MDFVLSIGNFVQLYPIFLILHFVFATISCSIGSFSYFLHKKIPNFWHHFFYFFVFLTGILGFFFGIWVRSFSKLPVGLNLILLAYLPLQKRGILTHTVLGFFIWGFSIFALGIYFLEFLKHFLTNSQVF